MNSSSEWLQGADRMRLLAEKCKDDKKLSAEAMDACGYACEFAIKALIMRRTGWNRWPTKAEKPEYLIHDLQKLLRLAGVELSQVPHDLRSSVKTAFSWRVESRYENERVPRRHSREMFEIVFGNQGVLAWLRTL